jgi:hypothetical protein
MLIIIHLTSEEEGGAIWYKSVDIKVGPKSKSKVQIRKNEKM